MLLCRFCPFMISSIPVSRRGGGGRGVYLLCIVFFFSFPLATYQYHSTQTRRRTNHRQDGSFFSLFGFFFLPLFYFIFLSPLFSLTLPLPSLLPFVFPSLRFLHQSQCCTYVLQRRSAKKTGSPGGVPG